MRSCQSVGVVATAATLAMMLGSATASAGFLDNLFTGRQPPNRATLSYAEPGASPSMARESGGGTGAAVTFCVRLCDGRFFPLQRHAGATPVQMCSALCPAAKTKVFNGSEIAHATATDGGRYADLDNAFVYRQKIVAGCTCNGRDAFGLAPMNVASDPTLRAGDMVTTQDGVQTVTGAQASSRKSMPVDPREPAGQRRVAKTGAAD